MILAFEAPPLEPRTHVFTDIEVDPSAPSRIGIVFLGVRGGGMGCHFQAMHATLQEGAERFADGKVHQRFDERPAFAHRVAGTGIVLAEVNISSFQRKSLIEFAAEESLAARFRFAVGFLDLRRADPASANLGSRIILCASRTTPFRGLLARSFTPNLRQNNAALQDGQRFVFRIMEIWCPGHESNVSPAA